MKTTKILASLVIVCMLATCMFCIAGTDTSNGNVIRSEESVVIDVDKSFQENEKQLAKLGITDSESWQYNDGYGCYVLTMKDVYYITSSLNGLVLISHSENANPKVVIELKGDNVIISGSEKTSEKQTDDWSSAIVAGHLNSSGVDLYDINVVITGDGSLEVTNANLSHDISCASGMCVKGNLTICDQAVVVAVGGNIDHNCTGTHSGSSHLALWSAGVIVTDKLSVIDASLFGTGGDYYLMFESKPTIEIDYVYSDGVAASKYYIKNGYVYGTGGSIDYGSMSTEYIKNQHVLSLSKGVTYIQESNTNYEYSTEIDDSMVIGIGGKARGSHAAFSYGISFKSDETVNIDDSVIGGKSDDTICNKDKDIDFMGTIGVNFESATNIKGSMVQGLSGDHAVEPTGIIVAYGISCKGTLTVENSIIDGESRTTISSVQMVNEHGIYVGNDFNVADSEIYATGADGAIYISKTLTASQGNRGCYKIDDDGNKTAINVGKEAFEGNKTVELLYKYDLIIIAENGLILGFERLDNGNYIVEPYAGYIPDGMKFAGYFDQDGNAVEVGTQVTIDDPLVLVATFDVVEEPEPLVDDDNGTWTAWIIVIVALVAAALLVAGVCIYKRS